MNAALTVELRILKKSICNVDYPQIAAGCGRLTLPRATVCLDDGV